MPEKILKDFFDDMIAQEGFVLYGADDGDVGCLYTIGNTQSGCPELFIIHDLENRSQYVDLLCSISVGMQCNDAMPVSGKKFKAQHYDFKAIAMDQFYIHHVASVAVLYYPHRRIKMIQLLHADAHNHYPGDCQYDKNYLIQPLFVGH